MGNAYQAQMPEFAHDLGHAEADFTYSVAVRRRTPPGRWSPAWSWKAAACCRRSPRTAFVARHALVRRHRRVRPGARYPLALVLLFVAGFLELSFNAMAQTLVQLRAPDRIRGRVIGLYNMSSLGLRAFAGVTVGLLGSLIGIHWSLALSAMALLSVTIALAALGMRSR